ncbi:MAG: sugar phosphate nucleotidyltransferase [archaeon]
MKKHTAVVYMVAGLSSRFGGRIKQFARVGKNGETLIELSLEQATSVGFDKIVFIVGKMTEAPFREMFGDYYNGIPIYYAHQMFDVETRDRPWGTGDALCCARDILDCDFVVCNGDDIYGENTFKILYEHLQKHDEDATVGYKLVDVLSQKGGVNRGMFTVSEGFVERIDETFNITPENLISKGLRNEEPCSQNIFALHPRVVEMLSINLEIFKKENKDDRKIEFLLSNELSDLIKIGKIRMKIYHTPDKWIGVTNPEDEEIVREFLKNNS